MRLNTSDWFDTTGFRNSSFIYTETYRTGFFNRSADDHRPALELLLGSEVSGQRCVLMRLIRVFLLHRRVSADWSPARNPPTWWRTNRLTAKDRDTRHTHTLKHSLTHTHTHTYGAFPLHGTARYGSLLGGFPLGTVPGTCYFFSTTSAEVPSDPYRYQNVTGKLCWSLIGRRESSLLRQWTCDTRPIDPLDLNQHSQRRSGRTFLHQPQMICFIVCWGSSDVPLVDSRGADPVRAWWHDAEGKRLLCI